MQIPENHKILSFEVESLFTSIPLQLALDCTKNPLKNSAVEQLLPTGNIKDQYSTSV